MDNKVKWYNEPQMVGTLLILFPPVGMYGLYKSEEIDPKWKKITFGILAMTGALLAITYLF